MCYGACMTNATTSVPLLGDLTTGEWARNGFTTQVHVRGAFDCIVQPCGQRGCGERKMASHGRGSAEVMFWLLGPAGGVEFTLHSGWYLPDTPPAMRREQTAGPIWAHMHAPWYDDQDRHEGDCLLARQDHCYADGSYLAGDDAFEALVRRGTDGLWALLSDWYDDSLRDVQS